MSCLVKGVRSSGSEASAFVAMVPPENKTVGR